MEPASRNCEHCGSSGFLRANVAWSVELGRLRVLDVNQGLGFRENGKQNRYCCLGFRFRGLGVLGD